MRFCPECGQDLRGSTKFCPECGANLSKFSELPSEQNDVISQPKVEQIDTTDPSKQTAKDLGNKLEETVGRIFADKGYQISLRQKLIGRSQQRHEIDVVAKSGQVSIAIECKNYSEDRKIGIEEIRNFIEKLNDLGIHQGYFITNTDFSYDARNYAKNGTDKQIELWDNSKLKEQIMQLTLGRGSNKVLKIENSFPLRGNFDDYSVLSLRNKQNVSIKNAVLSFHPFYIVSFVLREQFKTPDKQIHSNYNSGKYFIDAISGEVLGHIDEHGRVYHDIDDEQGRLEQE